jgi:hypothetical protein
LTQGKAGTLCERWTWKAYNWPDLKHIIERLDAAPVWAVAWTMGGIAAIVWGMTRPAGARRCGCLRRVDDGQGREVPRVLAGGLVDDPSMNEQGRHAAPQLTFIEQGGRIRVRMMTPQEAFESDRPGTRRDGGAGQLV